MTLLISLVELTQFEPSAPQKVAKCGPGRMRVAKHSAANDTHTVPRAS